MKFLSPITFSCSHCGECCRPVVKVSEKDIKNIEKLGWEREAFLDFDPVKRVVSNARNKKDTLKRVNGVCVFLKYDGKEKRYTCSIYDQRPEICRKFPFFEGKENLKDCKPQNWKYWMPLKELMGKGEVWNPPRNYRK